MYVTYLHMGLHHGNVDMKFNAQRRVSGITFINYTETQNNWEPNNSNVFEWKKNKRPKHKEDISWNFQFCFIYIHWIYINHRIDKKTCNMDSKCNFILLQIHNWGVVVLIEW